MYSPKISEELIPYLYRIAKAKKMPMTKLVSQIVAKAIGEITVESKVVQESVVAEKEVFYIPGSDA